MKRFLSILVVFALLFSLTASMALADTTGGGARVGVSMPTQSLQRWNQDGANMQAQLEAAGYTVDLQYAGNNEIALQVSQIEQMLTNGAKVLVIAAIDGSSLGSVLDEAKSMNVPVIAYDRLIMNSDAVSYYATFDNTMVGTIQGQYIEEQLGLKDGKGPFNIEFVAGDPGDNNATFFYNGAMAVLKPYIDNGQLVVPSGQVDFAQVATPSWSTQNSQARMDNIITQNYATGAKLDAVMCSNDSTALGVTNSLQNAGFTLPFPIITGQDCDIPNVKNIIAGYQSMSIFKDTRTLASKVVGMVDAIMKGTEPEINDTTTYDNGVKVVPSYLCTPVFADVNNWQSLLIDSGYYTLDQINAAG